MATIYRHWFPCTVTPENPHGKGYNGQTYQTVEERDRQRFAPSHDNDSVSLKWAIAKYGQENMQTDIIEDNILPIPDLVDEREIYWIAYFDDFHNGYNQTIGGDGFNPETSREIQRNRIADGTHNFLGGENNRNRVADGTHNFLGGETQNKRVADGTHNFLDSEFREFQKEIARKTNRRRIEDGTHNFLGGENNRKHSRETQNKRVADGTHHFLDSEFQREVARKRVADGTHPLLAKNRCPEAEKRRLKALRNTYARKRHKVYWYYIIALSRYWYETHAYSIQYRGAFDNQAIPDTADAKQLELF